MAATSSVAAGVSSSHHVSRRAEYLLRGPAPKPLASQTVSDKRERLKPPTPLAIRLRELASTLDSYADHLAGLARQLTGDVSDFTETAGHFRFSAAHARDCADAVDHLALRTGEGETADSLSGPAAPKTP
jgi:hypothetical protein